MIEPSPVGRTTGAGTETAATADTADTAATTDTAAAAAAAAAARSDTAAMTTATDTTALLRKALATSAVLWVETEPGRSWPLWFAADDVRVYLASGGQEQVLPDLPDRVVLAVRSKEDGGRLLRVPARTTRLQPGDAAWAGAVAALAARRLNAPAGDLGERWAREATVVSVLVPDGDPLEGPGHYQHESGASVPVDSPATTIGWRPWHAGGRPRLRRRRRR